MRKLIITLALPLFAFCLNAETVNVKIDGMTCKVGCVAKVGKALSKVDGVEKKGTKVQLGKAKVTFDETETSKEEVVKAIEKAGFTVAEK